MKYLNHFSIFYLAVHNILIHPWLFKHSYLIKSTIYPYSLALSFQLVAKRNGCDLHEPFIVRLGIYFLNPISYLSLNDKSAVGKQRDDSFAP